MELQDDIAKQRLPPHAVIDPLPGAHPPGRAITGPAGTFSVRGSPGKVSAPREAGPFPDRR